eukprot:12202768-Alexandrium_andersonii.AAC.1
MGALAAVVEEGGPDLDVLVLGLDLPGALAALTAHLVVLLLLQGGREGDRAEPLGLPHALLA